MPNAPSQGVNGYGKNLQISVDGQLKTNPTITLASVHQINLYGHGGDDRATITGLAIPVYLEGGAGNNSLVVNGPTMASTFVLGDSSLTVNGVAYQFGDQPTSLTINGQAKNDSLAMESLPIFAVAFSGGSGTDTLTGPNTTNAWNITSTGAGVLNSSLRFSAVENLTGGSDDDSFAFSAGKTISGKVDGGGGSNTLDYRAYTTALTVNLQTQKATGTGGFANIESFIGGTKSDTLIGANQANSWEITGSNSGTLSRGSVVSLVSGGSGNGISFASFENLTGGTLSDTFQVDVSASESGKIDGAAGADTLIGPDQTNTWNITAKNGGKLNGGQFANLENLTGGTGDDDFNLANGQGISGHLDGGAGHNTLDYSAYKTTVKVNLAAGTATNITGGVSNISDVLGGSANDTLTGDANNNFLSGNGGNDTLTGGGGSNILMGGAGNDNLTGSDGRDLLFGGAGVDTLLGGAGEDILFNGTTSIDGNRVAIDNLLAFWNRTDLLYGDRVNQLRTGSIAGVPAINATNDTSSDTLTGGGDLDWFFAKLTAPNQDTITDRSTDELTN